MHLSEFNIKEDPTKYATLMNQWLQKAREIANIRVNKNVEKEATYFDPKRRPVNYRASNLVLLWSPLELRDEDREGQAQEKGLATKLFPTWQGISYLFASL